MKTHLQNMVQHIRGIPAIGLLAALLLALASTVAAEDRLSYADHTPGHKIMGLGHSAYRVGRYDVALQNYQRAAYWGDKFGHYNVGVMHYHGKGTIQDVPRAWAWFELAAEREYPQMREVADLLWGRLIDEQREEGRRILNSELIARYGDEAAIRRASRRMNRERRKVAGSRTGHIGAMQVLDVDGYARVKLTGDAILIDYVGRSVSGDEFFNRGHWDFDRVIATEGQLLRALHGGNVTIRDFEVPGEG